MTGSSTKPRIGIIGVGLMGHGITRQLLEKDYPVAVLGHQRRERIDDVITHGAVEAANIAELAGAADVVLIIVPPPAVAETGETVLSHAGTDHLVAVLSTCNPGITEKLAAAAETRNVPFLEACMLNGPANARDGSLQLLAAGPESAVSQAQPLFDHIAERTHIVGDKVGAAQRTKLFNNAIYNIGMATACEIAAHAKTQDIDITQLLEIMSSGGGGALKAVERALARIADPDAPTQARVVNGRNVFKAYMDIAADAGARTPVAEGAFSVFEAAMAAGLEDEDQTKMSAMLET